jgi:isoleucyl-tRNA synthetase
MAKTEGKGFVVYMDMNITPELEREGIARDVVRRIQSLRKDMDLQYDRTVKMGIDGDPDVLKAMQEHMEHISRETLAIEVVNGEIPGGTTGEWDILGKKLKVWLLAI